MTVEEDLSTLLLKNLSLKDPLLSSEISESHNIDHNSIVGALKSLSSKDDLIKLENINEACYSLTEEGVHILDNGSHEVVFFNEIPKGGIAVNDITGKLKYGKVGMSKALSNRWIKVSAGADGKMVERIVDSVSDEIVEIMRKIKAADTKSIPDKTIADLKKRKLIKESKRTIFKITKGNNFTTEVKKSVVDLTPEMINDDSWKQYDFKAYNFEAKGVVPQSGALHPLLKVRSEVIRIMVEMGFVEMDLNQFVESSFWNFDALFQPQQHPARDAHDTFFIAKPAKTNIDVLGPRKYIENVKNMHQTGGSGSTGYKYDWKIEEAQKNLLRTHTTACSTRMLYRLAMSEKVKPMRLFLIDRVFRNEALDATHLAEFHQVEGLVADYNLGLGHLKAIIRAFFHKLGLTQLRFKPAFNPYTEPSMEIFSYHPGLGKWVEIGNSGIFRPEVVQPMNLPPNMNVIAWGISLERPTMIRYGYKNIRDLFGPKINLEMIQKSPLCRIEKH